MYSLSSIKQLHIEPTNKCNAACPMCTRTGNKIVENNLSDLSIEDFKTAFSPVFLQQIELIKFCGNLGDPALAPDLLAIHEYVYESNPNVRFMIHTNGGPKTTKWWSELGKFYAKSTGSFVNFHIDGLKDTNQIYRVNVVFDRVIENAKAFIESGGAANWVFIPFSHNEHQVSEAEALSKEYGFTTFAVKISARYKSDFYFKDKHGISRKIEPTNDFKIYKDDTEIKCSAKERGELYVDCWGNITPCCWMGSFDARPHSDTHRLLDKSGMNSDDINIQYKSLEQIVNSKFIQETIPNGWNDNPTKVCSEHCRGSKTHHWLINGEVKAQR